jgi:MinD-like ATPase involved in chromosome partitioning or flagellar assembly
MSGAGDRPYILLAIGDPERERQLLAALREGDCALAGRCLDGLSLVRQAQAGAADVVLAAAGLHRLTAESLVALREAGVPVVLLATPAEADAFDGLAYVLPEASDEAAVVAALGEAMRRGAVIDPAASTGPDADDAQRSLGDGEVISLVSGKGAPGATTVALGLAAALGRTGRRVLLIDGDLRGGAIGPGLDLDPRRGITGLSIGAGSRPERVLEELQDGPGFSVLAGVERSEAQERLRPEHVAGAIATLRERFDIILIDAGETISGVTSATGGAFIRPADRVLLVTTSDLFGLWNARSCLRFLTESLVVPPEAVSTVISRQSGTGNYGTHEVERALGIPVLAAIPEDLRAARQAQAEHRPIGGRAARAIAELASHLAGTTTVEQRPVSQELPAWRRWRRLPVAGRR